MFKYIKGFIEVIIDNPKEGFRIIILFSMSLIACIFGSIYIGIHECGKKLLTRSNRKDKIMDMYYHLKDELDCQDCKQPLKVSRKNGYMSYIAVCIICGKKYEIKLEVNLKPKG